MQEAGGERAAPEKADAWSALIRDAVRQAAKSDVGAAPGDHTAPPRDVAHHSERCRTAPDWRRRHRQAAFIPEDPLARSIPDPFASGLYGSSLHTDADIFTPPDQRAPRAQRIANPAGRLPGSMPGDADSGIARRRESRSPFAGAGRFSDDELCWLQPPLSGSPPPPPPPTSSFRRRRVGSAACTLTVLSIACSARLHD